MPELMALNLLVLVRRVLQTSPNINIYREDRYIDRHKAREDWTKSGAEAAGFYREHVLLNKPTLQPSIDDISKCKSLNV